MFAQFGRRHFRLRRLGGRLRPRLRTPIAGQPAAAGRKHQRAEAPCMRAGNRAAHNACPSSVRITASPTFILVGQFDLLRIRHLDPGSAPIAGDPAGRAAATRLDPAADLSTRRPASPCKSTRRREITLVPLADRNRKILATNAGRNSHREWRRSLYGHHLALRPAQSGLVAPIYPTGSSAWIGS